MISFRPPYKNEGQAKCLTAIPFLALLQSALLLGPYSTQCGADFV